jgi:hypothetical protein
MFIITHLVSQQNIPEFITEERVRKYNTTLIILHLQCLGEWNRGSVASFFFTLKKAPIM